MVIRMDGTVVDVSDVEINKNTAAATLQVWEEGKVVEKKYHTSRVDNAVKLTRLKAGDMINMKEVNKR